MNPLLDTLLPRLMAICALVCMAAMLHSGFVAAQSDVLNIQHMASGDLQLADGGWSKACDGERDDCDGHLVAPHSDGGEPMHHHHPGGETSFGAVVTDVAPHAIVYATVLDLRPGDAARLAGRYVSTPDQPPRV